MPVVIKGTTLKYVKQILIEYCPWQLQAKSARLFQSHVGSSSVRLTNAKCSLKTTVKHDGTHPMITILFDDGKQVIFKSRHLTAVEMLQRFGTLNFQRDKILGESDAGR